MSVSNANAAIDPKGPLRDSLRVRLHAPSKTAAFKTNAPVAADDPGLATRQAETRNSADVVRTVFRIRCRTTTRTVRRDSDRVLIRCDRTSRIYGRWHGDRCPASVPPSAQLVRAGRLHNYRMLRTVTEVDPLRWPEADSIEGWNFEWWAVDFGEPGGPRLGLADGQHCDLKPDGTEGLGPAAVRLPRTTRISRSDDLDHDRYQIERAAAKTRCASFLSDEPFANWCGKLDAVGVGYDSHTLDDMTVGISAWPLHREHCLGELNWEFVRGKWPDVSLILEGKMILDRVVRLGAMVDDWSPIPEGAPALAEATGYQFDMLAEAPEHDTDWLVHRLSLGAHGPSWWCRWCPERERRPAQYVVGGPAGAVSCAAHLPNAAEHEQAPDEELT